MTNILTAAVSIHAPRVGSDLTQSGLSRPAKVLFQSTLPVWGATCLASWDTFHRPVSIHAPRVGSDDCILLYKPRTTCFNPRSPCGERQPGTWPTSRYWSVSIHAPRVGSDAVRRLLQHWMDSFNPRSPCGERREVARLCRRIEGVSIHAPRVGSDILPSGFSRLSSVSIHAPRVGSDAISTHPLRVR